MESRGPEKPRQAADCAWLPSCTALEEVADESKLPSLCNLVLRKPGDRRTDRNST